MSNPATDRRALGALAPAALCCVWMGLVDGAVAQSLAPVPPAASLWLLVTTIGLTGVVLLPLALLLSPLRRWRPLAALRRRIDARPLLRRALVALALGASLLAHWINATQYVRLYLLLHLLLSGFAIVAAWVGFALALPEASRLRTWRPHPVVLAAGIAGWMAVAALSLWTTLGSHQLRALAIEQTTLLGHELILLDRLTGVLAAPEPVATGDLPPELLAALEPRPLRASDAPRRNIVLLTVDSLRADRLTSSGAREAMLPRLERLAADSVVFSRAYTPSCWTVHAMTSVLTSHLPSAIEFSHVSVSPDLRFTVRSEATLIENPVLRKRITPVPIDDEHPTLPGLLRDAGYRSITVAPYVFYLREAGVTRDFDVVDETSYRSLSIDGSGITQTPLVDRALASIDELEPGQPFFVWLHFMEPHAPYEARDERARGGDDVARYDSELRFVDQEIGRLLDELRTRDLYDESIVVVHADHGEEFGDHGGSFHATTLFEEIVHVPLVLKLPASEAQRRRVHAPVSLIDLAPTLLDLVGVDAPAPLMGRSLRDLLGGRDAAVRPVVSECFRFGRKRRALILMPFKLIVDEVVGTVQLFDLIEDPGERRNLADERGEVTDGLHAVLRAIGEQIDRASR